MFREKIFTPLIRPGWAKMRSSGKSSSQLFRDCSSSSRLDWMRPLERTLGKMADQNSSCAKRLGVRRHRDKIVCVGTQSQRNQVPCTIDQCDLEEKFNCSTFFEYNFRSLCGLHRLCCLACRLLLLFGTSVTSCSPNDYLKATDRNHE